jgi:hypothetical protein
MPLSSTLNIWNQLSYQVGNSNCKRTMLRFYAINPCLYTFFSFHIFLFSCFYNYRQRLRLLKIGSRYNKRRILSFAQEIASLSYEVLSFHPSHLVPIYREMFVWATMLQLCLHTCHLLFFVMWHYFFLPILQVANRIPKSVITFLSIEKMDFPILAYSSQSKT